MDFEGLANSSFAVSIVFDKYILTQKNLFLFLSDLRNNLLIDAGNPRNKLRSVFPE